ncbi:hypothetical protein Y032_0214g2316 [Ancylostoma ceylanicum]|nr:hypothetical protein Y032_0214g2316 [Ancylostoma ceylanicum]
MEADTSKMVKEYARPAAGCDHLHPECLRPPDVLVQTVHYLLEMYAQEKRARFGCVYSFVFDRLRAVRQDMILQDVSPVDTVRILQEMIPFYFDADYLCRTRRCDAYDGKLHSNSLEECLSRWREAAPAVPKEIINPSIVCANILHQIPVPSALVDIYIWREFLEGDLFDVLRDIVVAYRCNNYIRFFRKLLQLPVDSVAVAAVQAVETLRYRALSTISIAYRSPNVKIPIDVLANWLHYKDSCDLVDVLSCCSTVHSDSVVISSINLNNLLGEQSLSLLAKF